jgi:membrane protease YdiL (CAAX protease family)
MGIYLLARDLLKPEYDSVTKVMESYQLIILGINLIMFLLIILFFAKKERVKKNNIHERHKKLIFSLSLVYSACILTTPILFFKKNEIQTSIADNISWVLLSINFINLVILPSLNEELIFRGYILNKFIDSKRELIVGIIFSSILFASIHINPLEFNYRSIIYTFILGLVFGLIYIKFGIIVSIVSHAFINVISYIQKYLNVDLNILNNFDIGFAYWLIMSIAAIVLITLYYKGFSSIQVKSSLEHRIDEN